jgi:hypothetical protein
MWAERPGRLKQEGSRERAQVTAQRGVDGWQALFLPDDQSFLPETEVADRDTVPILIPHGGKEAFSLSHFEIGWLTVWVASIRNADSNAESNGGETGRSGKKTFPIGVSVAFTDRLRFLIPA